MKTDKANDKEFIELEIGAPESVDRRAFLMRSATIGAAAVLTGCSTEHKAAQVGGVAPPPPASRSLSTELSPGGPGPSSSHTIGPMRIAYDFYNRCTRLPPTQL